MRLAILVLLALSMASAECGGRISQAVPAVVGNGGGLVNVTVALVPGDGNAYVTARPRTGTMTQESVESAVAYAYGLSGSRRDCDVLVSFASNPDTGMVEGPSAGAALAVMAYALLEGREPRGDAVVTGTIDSRGNVGPVGGLYEKAKGAAAAGADYFITPVENVYEMLLLRDMEARYGITIIQARRAEDVIGFMLENRTIDQAGMEVQDREIPELPEYDSSGMGRFSEVAEAMIALEEGVADSIDYSEGTEAVGSFFDNEADRQKSILEDGYLFSAANEAFLNFVDVSTIKVIAEDDADLPRKKGEAGICLSGVARPKATDLNFEWVSGADLRRQWALEKLNSTDIEGPELADEKFVAYNELMYAQAWCHVAKELLAAAPSGGSPVDESSWRGIADAKIGEARSVLSGDADTARRMAIAEDSYSRGLYGAAIFDAVYVIETERAASWTPDDGEVDALINESRESLWGMVYQSHAAFLYAQNQTAGAYRTALFARGIDEATLEMEDAMAVEGPDSRPAAPQSGGGPDLAPLLAAEVAISIFLLIVLAILLSRGIYGNHSARPGKAPGAQQKKGGTGIPEGGARRGYGRRAAARRLERGRA